MNGNGFALMPRVNRPQNASQHIRDTEGVQRGVVLEVRNLRVRRDGRLGLTTLRPEPSDQAVEQGGKAEVNVERPDPGVVFVLHMPRQLSSLIILREKIS